MAKPLCHTALLLWICDSEYRTHWIFLRFQMDSEVRVPVCNAEKKSVGPEAVNVSGNTGPREVRIQQATHGWGHLLAIHP